MYMEHDMVRLNDTAFGTLARQTFCCLGDEVTTATERELLCKTLEQIV